MVEVLENLPHKYVYPFKARDYHDAEISRAELCYKPFLRSRPIESVSQQRVTYEYK